MANYNKSTDVVAMDVTSPDHLVSFGKKSGCYISRSVGCLLAIIFISVIVATGLLVYFYVPPHKVVETPVRHTENINDRQPCRIIPTSTVAVSTITSTEATTSTTTTTSPSTTTTTTSPSTTTTTTSPSTTTTTTSPSTTTTTTSPTTTTTSPTTTVFPITIDSFNTTYSLNANSSFTTTDFLTTTDSFNITESLTTTDSDTTTTDLTSTTTTTTSDTTTTPTKATTTTATATTNTPTTATTTAAATPTTTSGQLKENINVRLPRALKPLHYLVKLQPFINGNYSILGYVEVEMEVLEPTLNITLHMADIITKNETVILIDKEDQEGAADLMIKKHEYDSQREFYVAHLEEALQQGHKYILSMEFTGLLNDNLRGFYRSTYRDAAGNLKTLAVSQFQATDARRAFPCFDEPGLKATFEVYLAREETMTSISNMPINNTFPVEGQKGWLWDQYQVTVPMSTYLVAFVISDFGHMNASDIEHILFRVWAREEALTQAQYALRVGPAILKHFEDYFNQSYPLPKQDMVAIPDLSAGAMENWGLITYRETAMLYDPDESAPINQYQVALVVAHELAHQWFGNIVTPKWWTDLWLNEGFATFVQYIGLDHVEPSWKVNEQFIIDKLQSVLILDSLESSHKIRIPVENYINQNFDAITYNKGASVIRMMSHFLTEETVRKGLSTYLDDFKYGNAEQDDLWEHLTQAAHQDGTLPLDLTVKTIMDTWTLQMGYPVITVERSPDGTSATVSQERFLMVAKSNSKNSEEYKWWVPLTYTGGDDPDFNETRAKVWMKDAETLITIQSLPTKDHWVIFNLQETGYYRVNYDNHNWNLLIQQLLTDHTVITTINRAQIIDDAMNLARAGQVSYEVALGLYGYMVNETEYVPWKAAVNNLAYLTSMLQRTGGYGGLQNYMLNMVVQLYDTLGLDSSVNDHLLEQYKRTMAVSWACSLRHKQCLDSVLTLYRQWMTNPDNNTIIAPSLKSVVYCQALAAGGAEEWDFAWNQYLKSNLASEKQRLLRAMGCTKQLWLLSRYLEMAFDPNSGIRRQDSELVFGSIALNDIGRPLAWTFLRDNWKMIYDYFEGKARAYLINSSTSNFNTRQQLKEVMTFVDEHRTDLKSASRKVEQKIETIKNNIAWMDANYETIHQWLEQKGYSVKLRNV